MKPKVLTGKDIYETVCLEAFVPARRWYKTSQSLKRVCWRVAQLLNSQLVIDHTAWKAQRPEPVFPPDDAPDWPPFRPADIHTPLWRDVGNLTTWGKFIATSVLRSRPDTNKPDVVAIIPDPVIARLLIIAPELLTCSEVLYEVLESLPAAQHARATEALAAVDAAMKERFIRP